MNHNDTHISAAAQSVLAKIKQGEISMRSKWRFALRIVAVGAVGTLAFLVSTFLVSFIIFASKASGHQFLLQFGAPGFRTFLAMFPWKLLALAVLLFIALRLLLSRYRWGYRNSFLFVFSAVALASIVAGSLVSATQLHQLLLERADNDDLPLLKGAYESLREPGREHDHGIYKGTITSTFDGGFMLYHDDVDSDRDDGIVTVYVPAGAAAPYAAGDMVFVAGEETDGNTIHAYGIQEVDLTGPIPLPLK